MDFAQPTPAPKTSPVGSQKCLLKRRPGSGKELLR